MNKKTLQNLYIEKGMSVTEISEFLGVTPHKINYWLNVHSISKRSISDAIYVKFNGLIDPFKIKVNLTCEEQALYGLGVGIYWGEGNKKSLTAVRVGNTDANLLKVFIRFLVEICGVKYEKIRYGLQIFTDIEESEALEFWQKELNIDRNQIMPTISRVKSGKIGTYKTKNQYGVMTVYVFNRKLRDWMVSQLIVPR